MEEGSRSTAALHAATMRLLRPLVRLLLRHAVPFGAFQEIAKRAYVEVALKDGFSTYVTCRPTAVSNDLMS